MSLWPLLGGKNLGIFKNPLFSLIFATQNLVKTCWGGKLPIFRFQGQFLLKMTPKMAQNQKISKIQKTSSLCIPKCQFLAKNEEIWTKWRGVHMFRRKFSDPPNTGISHTFREISRNTSRLRRFISRCHSKLFQFHNWNWRNLRNY